MNKKNFKRGFSLIEVLISVGILSIAVVLLSTFIFQLNYSQAKTKADREALENARRAMDIMAYEIRGADSIYASTTTASQLSLQTSRYLPAGEQTTFIDFFVCGFALCFKKESQNPITLTSDLVQVADLQFVSAQNGSKPSVKITMTINYGDLASDANHYASVTLNQTVALRNY